MRLSNYEKETIYNFNEAEAEASIYTHNRPLLKQLTVLAEQRPNECQLLRESHDGQAAEYLIPKKWIKICPSRKLSEAQEAAVRKALAAAADKRKTYSERTPNIEGGELT